MKNFGLFKMLLKEVKCTKANPELTQFLENSQAFKGGVKKVDQLTGKFWSALDKAAFPQNYKN